MGRIATAQTIRSLAAEFLDRAGLTSPPVSIPRCLDYQRLTVSAEALEDLLDGVNLPAVTKLDAMLHVRERRIWLRSGLHRHQRTFAILHELGHDRTPWQRDLLYHCSVFDLPVRVVRDWEREASTFAAECLFFGDRITEELLSVPFGLKAACSLAARYDVSFEATFRQYVERYPGPCCLLVSRVITISPSGGESQRQYEIQYYVNSSSFHACIMPHQRFQSPEIDVLCVASGLSTITTHDFEGDFAGVTIRYHAESFTNGYKIFTLISPYRDRPCLTKGSATK